jgi:hypothetical protein
MAILDEIEEPAVAQKPEKKRSTPKIPVSTRVSISLPCLHHSSQQPSIALSRIQNDLPSIPFHNLCTQKKTTDEHFTTLSEMTGTIGWRGGKGRAHVLQGWVSEVASHSNDGAANTLREFLDNNIICDGEYNASVVDVDLTGPNNR